MKKLILVALLCGAALTSHSQNTYPYPQNGNIGIGSGSGVLNHRPNYTGLTLMSASNGNYLDMYMGSSITDANLRAILFTDNTGFNILSATANPMHFFVNGSERFTISGAGRIGIGNLAPSEMLTLGNEDATNSTARKTLLFSSGGFAEPAAFNTGSNGDKLILYSSSAAGYDARAGVGTKGNLWFKSVGNGSGGMMEWYTGTTGSPKMTLNSDGNLGIGTMSPDQKLTVNGTIHASKIIVDTQIPVPDYVFEKDYKLRPLKEVEAYIKANKHLPEVASAKDMVAKGVDINELNMKLLQKMEEMTLYILELKRENNRQNTRIGKIERRRKTRLSVDKKN